MLKNRCVQMEGIIEEECMGYWRREYFLEGPNVSITPFSWSFRPKNLAQKIFSEVILKTSSIMHALNTGILEATQKNTSAKSAIRLSFSTFKDLIDLKDVFQTLTFCFTSILQFISKFIKSNLKVISYFTVMKRIKIVQIVIFRSVTFILPSRNTFKFHDGDDTLISHNALIEMMWQFRVIPSKLSNTRSVPEGQSAYLPCTRAQI